MESLSFLKHQSAAGVLSTSSAKALVDQRPWQTALTLAPLAVTNEETQFAQEAERLADHEVDQAFASALRQATAQVQHRVLTGDALALSQRVTSLQELVKEDQAAVKSLTPTPAAPSATKSPAPSEENNPNADDLEIAKAQLGLDSDQLSDAQQDLARASGDDRAQIQDELAEREAAAKKLDSESQKKQVAVLAAKNFNTLSARVGAWFRQRSRQALIEQARQQAIQDAATLTKQHNDLEKQADTTTATASSADLSDRSAKLASIRERSQQRQLLSIFDDRIQTEKQLAQVYSKWSAQVAVQHRIVLHLIGQSIVAIAFIVIFVILCDAIADKILTRPNLDRRRMQTLRTILQLGIQTLGIILVLLVTFGSPNQMPTILGLATAGLTVVLQDFIIAFFGWFVLMGKRGIRVGDWVEINGVGGEVAEIGLFRTTLLETGNWTDKGHPTGRRVTFINSYAIRGQYFNFSTTGQWLWDELTISIPASEDTYAMVESVHKMVIQETDKDAKLAEDEWKRGAHQDGLSQFTAERLSQPPPHRRRRRHPGPQCDPSLRSL